MPCEVVIRRKLRRSQMLQFFAKQPACLVGIEACASAHYWGRELSQQGHQVKLMPAGYVKPYVTTQHDELCAGRADCRTIVAAKVGDHLEVRHQAAGQPHQLDVALGLPFEPSARLVAIEIAIEIDLSAASLDDKPAVPSLPAQHRQSP